MVVIRLSRFGKKKFPFYRITVADKRMPRDGRFIEYVGTFNPFIAKKQIILKMDRIKYWLNIGAKPSNIVRSLIRKFIKLSTIVKSSKSNERIN